MTSVKGNFRIYDDLNRVNIVIVNKLLSTSYWAENRDIETIKKSIKHSVCYSVYKEERQIGFGRVISDYATFGYICDVIIANEFRGNGIGKWLMEVIVSDERWQGISLVLATADAHKLYESFGFKNTDKLMWKKPN